MELFRTCCGAAQIRNLENSNEIRNSITKLQHTKSPKYVNLSGFAEKMFDTPINITRIKCHKGDDSSPPHDEFDPLYNQINSLSQKPNPNCTQKINKFTGPTHQIFTIKFGAPPPKGDDIETDLETQETAENINKHEKPRKSKLGRNKSGLAKNRQTTSTQNLFKTPKKSLPLPVKVEEIDTNLLESNIRQAYNQLNSQAAKKLIRKSPSPKPNSAQKARSRSPYKKPNVITPSKNSQFSFCPSVVKLDLTERYKFEAGLATTLAKVQDVMKSNHKTPENKQIVYSMSDSPISTQICSIEENSITNTNTNTDQNSKNIVV